MASQVSGFATFTEDGGVNQPGSNLDRMAADDSSFATWTLGTGEATRTTFCTDGQSFTLPDDATIAGYLISIKFKTDGGSTVDLTSTFKGVTTYHTSLMLDGNADGIPTTNISFGAYSGTAEVTQQAGGPTDTWGAVKTAAEIKQSGFGVAFQFVNTGAGTVVLSINHASLTVYYTAAGPPRSTRMSVSLGCGL